MKLKKNKQETPELDEKLIELRSKLLNFHRGSFLSTLRCLVEVIDSINVALEQASGEKSEGNSLDHAKRDSIEKDVSRRIRSKNVPEIFQLVLECLVVCDHITMGPAETKEFIYGGSEKLSKIRRKAKSPKFCFIKPVRACQDILAGLRRAPDIEYLMLTYITEHRNVYYCSETIAAFRAFAATVNKKLGIIMNDKRGLVTFSTTRQRINRMELEKELAVYHVTEDKHLKELITVFLFISEMLGIIELDLNKPGMFLINGIFDPDYMLARLFGLKTSIPGFDALFGGGIVLPKHTKKAGDGHGKILLLRGGYGSGKTTCACQIAFEIARKGGIAVIFALDQDLSELKQQFHAFGWLPSDGSFVFAETLSDFIKLGTRPKRPELGLIGVGGISKTDHAGHFEAISAFIHQDFFQKFSLRIVVVDPINSVIPEEKDLPGLRNRTNMFFGSLKSQCVSAIFTAESEEDQNSPFHHERNIADHVIRLWSEESEREKYKQRYLEIAKSRGQATHRGRQPFTIANDRGIHIFLSSAAFLGLRSKRRYTQRLGMHTSSGIMSLDRILVTRSNKKPSGGFCEGDVVVFSGSPSSGKSDLAFVFLLQKTINKSARSLYVTFGGTVESTLEILELNGIISATIMKESQAELLGKGGQIERLVILPFAGGFVRPGEFFRKLILEFERARSEGYFINKVVIDNIRYMEEHCPLIVADQPFVTTLMQVLRTEKCTTIINCTNPSNNPSALQQEIRDSADCVIDFKKIYFRGERLNAFHIVKSFTNTHDGRAYELSLDRREGITITKKFSLLKNIMQGSPQTIPVSLFLHSETEDQHRYNKTLQATLQTILVSTVKLQNEDVLSSLRMADIGIRSAFNELQVVQIDEHQMSHAGAHWLEHFPIARDPTVNLKFPKSVLPCFTEGNEFWAMPLYGNVSMLAYDSARIKDNSLLTDWRVLSEHCTKTKKVVFDYPKVSDENFNCLFLEILLWVMLQNGHDIQTTDNMQLGPCLRDILKNVDLVTKALELFWGVGHRAFAKYTFRSKTLNNANPTQAEEYAVINVDPNASVWRLWHCTLSELFKQITQGKQESIKITSLPGDIAVAGDWFLGVTKFSAAKDVGLDILKTFTSPTSAQIRWEQGIGFPLHSMFLESGTATYPSPLVCVKPNFLVKTYVKAFRRSSFGCYFYVTGSLAYYLRHILSISHKRALRREIKMIVPTMNKHFDKIWALSKDRKCQNLKKRRCTK